MYRITLSAVLALALAPSFATAQQVSADAQKEQAKIQPAPAGKKSCRNISAEMRSGAPLTRDIVIAEMLRARAEGEMDFHISSTPPAVYRPMCELPPPAASQPAAAKDK